MIPLIVTAISATGAWLLLKKPKQTGMTPDKQKQYDLALNSVVSSEALKTLANTFHGEGLTEEATLLRKRAALKDAAPDVKEQRREALRQGLRSKDKAKVLELAKAFDDLGATGCANRLRQYAAGLKDATANMPAA